MQCQLGTDLTWMNLQRIMSSFRKDRNWKGSLCYVVKGLCCRHSMKSSMYVKSFLTFITDLLNLEKASQRS